MTADFEATAMRIFNRSSGFQRDEAEALLGTGDATAGTADTVIGVGNGHDHPGTVIFFIFNVFRAEDIARAGFVAAAAADALLWIDCIRKGRGPVCSPSGFPSQ